VSEMVLGPFEESVLAAVFRLRDEAYGVPIMRDLEERLKRRVTVGALYGTLERLESKGLLKSRLGEPTPQRGGRSKKFYTLTASGVRTLQAAWKRTRRRWSGVPAQIHKPA